MDPVLKRNPYLATLLPFYLVFYRKTPPATGVPEIFDFYRIQRNQKKHHISALSTKRMSATCFSESYNDRVNLSGVGQCSHAARTLFLGLVYTYTYTAYFAGAAMPRPVRPHMVTILSSTGATKEHEGNFSVTSKEKAKQGLASREVPMQFHYVDDFRLLGPTNSPVCATSFCQTIEICKELGVPVAYKKSEG